MIETEIVKKNKPWQFQPGQSGNAGGTGYQKYGDRVKYIEMKYTPEDILELTANPSKLNKLPVRDVQIIRRIAVTLADIAPTTRTEIRMELESHLDRVEGKSTQTINVHTTEEQAISQLADDRLLRLEQELSRMTGSEAVLIAPEPVKIGDDA